MKMKKRFTSTSTRKLSILVALITLFLVPAGYTLAVWNPAPANPPAQNAPTPINVSGNLQYKTGNLILGQTTPIDGVNNAQFGVTRGPSFFKTRVGIGAFPSLTDVIFMVSGNSVFNNGTMAIGTPSFSPGLASKNYTLQVKGGSYFDGSIVTNGNVTATNNLGVNNGLADGGELVLYSASTTGKPNFYLDNYSGKFRIFNNTGQHFSIAPGGQTLIGLTSPTNDPAALKLRVGGKVGASEYCDINGNNCFDPATVGGGNWIENNGNVFRENGRVGIGIPSTETLVGQLLHVRNSNGNTGVLIEAADGFAAGLNIKGHPNYGWSINQNPSGRLAFWRGVANGGEGSGNKMVIAPNGNVGIGESNPLAKLHVDGGTLLNGRVLLTGDNFLLFGAGVDGKQRDAGKIGYQTFSDGLDGRPLALDIIGAGSANAPPGERLIKLWDNVNVGGDITVEGDICDGEGSCVSATEVVGGSNGSDKMFLRATYERQISGGWIRTSGDDSMSSNMIDENHDDPLPFDVGRDLTAMSCPTNYKPIAGGVGCRDVRPRGINGPDTYAPVNVANRRGTKWLVSCGAAVNDIVQMSITCAYDPD